MIPVQLDTHIAAPREEVFDFVADLANRPSWTDHFQSEYHMTRTWSDRVGAAARYRTDPPFGKQLYSDLAIVELDRPRRIFEEGVQGRLNKTDVQIVWDFEQEGPELVHVTFDMRTQTHGRLAALSEIGAHGYYRRQWRSALSRLRRIFEEPPRGELARATIAGYEPLKAPRYG